VEWRLGWAACGRLHTTGAAEKGIERIMRNCENLELVVYWARAKLEELKNSSSKRLTSQQARLIANIEDLLSILKEALADRSLKRPERRGLVRKTCKKLIQLWNSAKRESG
jgi:hypothetical protein